MEEIFEIFEKVSGDVITKMTGMRARVDQDYEKFTAANPLVYTSFVKVAGAFKGAVTMTIKKETAIRLARGMLGNQPLKKLDSLAESAILELTNMIVGGAMTQLSESSGAINISHPTITNGKNVAITIGGKKLENILPMAIAGGVIVLNIGLIRNPGS